MKLKALNKAVLFEILHKECLDDNIVEAVEQLATTTIIIEKLDETKASLPVQDKSEEARRQVEHLMMIWISNMGNLYHKRKLGK